MTGIDLWRKDLYLVVLISFSKNLRVKGVLEKIPEFSCSMVCILLSMSLYPVYNHQYRGNSVDHTHVLRLMPPVYIGPG